MTYNELLEWHFDFSVGKLQLKNSTKREDIKLLRQINVISQHFKKALHYLDEKENGLYFNRKDR